MNLLMLLLIVGILIKSPSAFLGICAALSVCFLLETKKGKENIIKKFTTWKWFDIFA